MNFKTLAHKTPLILIFLLVVVRFVHIDELPVFLDEATYLQFASEIKNNPSYLFVSFPAAVLPMMVWSLALCYKLFGGANMLIVGRVLLATCDIVSTFIVFLLGKELLNKKYAYMSLLIYLLLPLNFFHSRIVLLESMTNLFFLIGVYLFIKLWKALIETPKQVIHVRRIFLVSSFLSLSYFTKPLAIVSLGSIFFFPFSYNFKRLLQKPKSVLSLVLVFIFFGILILPFSIMVYPQFSDYHVNTNGNMLYLFNHFKLNLWRAYWWMKAYITPPIMGAILIASIVGIIKKSWLAIWLTLWFSSILVIESFVGTNYFPRHLYPITAPVALLVGLFLYTISKRSAHMAVIIGVAVMTVSVRNDLLILKDPVQAPLALEDTQQFFQDWTSGVGLREVAQYINQIPVTRRFNLYIEDDSLLGWALPTLYLRKDVTLIKIRYPLTPDIYQSMSLASGEDSYILLNRSQFAPGSWPVTQVFSYPKGPHRNINIYKL